MLGRFWLVLAAFVIFAFAACSSYETFSDVQPSELNEETVWPGMKLRLQYEDGTKARLTVREITESEIVSMDGSRWPKSGISTLTEQIPAKGADCGSLASWRHGQCWKDEVHQEWRWLRRL